MYEDRIARAVVAALLQDEVLTAIAHRIGEEVAAALRADLTVSIEGAEAPSSVGDMRIDRERREVHIGDRTIHLKPREFALLQTLARRPGRVFRRRLATGPWTFTSRGYGSSSGTVGFGRLRGSGTRSRIVRRDDPNGEPVTRLAVFDSYDVDETGLNEVV